MITQIDYNAILKIALSKYDFELIKDCILNGADPDDIILHRVINRDRVDLLEFFLFSPEIKNHCKLNYEYPYFGENPAFKVACSNGAIDCVKFIMNDTRVCHTFNFKKIAQTGLNYASEHGSIEVVEYLLSSEKTKDHCTLSYNNYEPISLAISRLPTREPFLTHFILNMMEPDVIPLIEPLFLVKNNYNYEQNKEQHQYFLNLLEKQKLKLTLEKNLPLVQSLPLVKNFNKI